MRARGGSAHGIEKWTGKSQSKRAPPAVHKHSDTVTRMVWHSSGHVEQPPAHRAAPRIPEHCGPVQVAMFHDLALAYHLHPSPLLTVQLQQEAASRALFNKMDKNNDGQRLPPPSVCIGGRQRASASRLRCQRRDSARTHVPLSVHHPPLRLKCLHACAGRISRGEAIEAAEMMRGCAAADAVRDVSVAFPSCLHEAAWLTAEDPASRSMRLSKHTTRTAARTSTSRSSMPLFPDAWRHTGG